MSETLTSLRTSVLTRLGDAGADVWSEAEITLYLEQGYREAALATRAFWDQAYLENLPPGFAVTADWEAADTGVTFQYGAIANYTLADERRLLDEHHRLGPGNHTHPEEATDDWVDDCGADTSIPATVEMPDAITELDLATWDHAVIEAMSPSRLAAADTRYQVTEGEVYGYTWRQDGVRTFRKIRKPSAMATTWAVTGNWGLARRMTDVTADTPTGTWGLPRRVPTQHVLDGGTFGAPRRFYADALNVRVDHWREGWALDGWRGCELPTRYALYLRDYAQAKALTRSGPGQDMKLGAHYWQRWQRGVARILRRRQRLPRPRVGGFQQAPVLGGTRPPRPKLPWQYGQTLR